MTRVADADVYYAIRQAAKQAGQDSLAEIRRNEDLAWKAWENELSSHHIQRCVRGLLRNKTLSKALDPLVEIAGLREGMMISTMHKLISCKADEEAEAYLSHTWNTWKRIVGSSEALEKLDAKDVQALELRCPRFCIDDAQIISKLIKEGSIFQAFEESERAAIETNILEIDTLIPSLYTFSQDIHLLEACAASMRHVVSPKEKTIRQTLLSARREGLSTSDASAGIQEIWAFMLRNFPTMPHPKANTDTKCLAGPLIEPSLTTSVSQAARLTLKHGFQTSEARIAASRAHDDESPGSPKQSVHPSPAPSSYPIVQIQKDWIVKDSPDIYKKRCGKPRAEAFHCCQPPLTWSNLQTDIGDLRVQGRGLTAFFTLRCQFLAFFGSSSDNVTYSWPPRTPTSCPTPFLLRHIPFLREHSSSPDPSIGDVRAMPSPGSSYASATVPNTPESGDEGEPGEMRGNGSAEAGRVLFTKFDGRAFRDETWIEAEGNSVEKAATDFILQGWVLLSTTSRLLIPEVCYKDVQAGTLNTVILVDKRHVKNDRKFKEAAHSLQEARPIAPNSRRRTTT